MSTSRAFAALAAAVDAERVAAGPRAAWAPEAVEAIFFDEIAASTWSAGSRLSNDEVRTLVTRGLATGGRSLNDYVLVADYAAAATLVATALPPSRRRPHVRLDEIVRLHALAMRRGPAPGAGTWRTTTAPPFPSGMRPPPSWLVPRDTTAFVERFGLGPGSEHPALWAARAHARLTRISPFANGTGRTTRLVTNLLLHRCDLPPFAVRPRDRDRYLAAMAHADAGDDVPLASVLARSLLAALQRLAAARVPDEGLAPLAVFATGARRASLYKAAQRGRLRTLRRGGALLTTPDWIARYERSRERTGASLGPRVS